MCKLSEYAKIFSFIYIALIFLLPILYIMYKSKKHKKNEKYMLKAFILFIALFLVKFILNLDVGAFDCGRCYINNNCSVVNSDEKKEEKKDNKTNSTTEKTTKTVKTTTSTTTVPGQKIYPKLKVDSTDKKSVGKSSKGFDIELIDGSYYIDGYLIANKTYKLADGFVPSDTYSNAVGITSTCNTCINNTAYSAWKDLKAEADKLGLNIWIQSGYRPYSVQVSVYNRYVNRDGKQEADTYSSRPGHSEHQTGLSFDLNSITDAFTNTKEGKWINDNCYKYGFVIRFPKDKDEYTGYMYESWHLRYVGTDLATKLYNDGDWISMEEYFGVTSKYED